MAFKILGTLLLLRALSAFFAAFVSGAYGQTDRGIALERNGALFMIAGILCFF